MRMAHEMSQMPGDHYFLKDLTVVVDVEPCFMCAMALIHSRVGTVVFAHRNGKDGGLVSIFGGKAAQIFDLKQLNHSFAVFELK